ILVATTNPHKLGELRDILAPLGISVRGLDSLAAVPPEPEENEPTFEGNARVKALEYARATGVPCLAEDSGLEVDALGGAPGVRSARYSGEGGPRAERDQRNNEKLLAELRDVPSGQRAARFVCAMCLATPDGRVLAETRGTYEGEIAVAPRGERGFGYDPLLWLPDVGRTSAELSPEEKHARSHRGAAARALAARLTERDRDAPGSLLGAG
ncbi:MAG: RdgB/HAM1 family non-canonical purine NTP pyrophosphatase, partial [Deltaproteobacteria bacterium]|nr:RdgB/HAM1 family non-canonical purine NTP pyrophosphatase [Deltaproteobacteria bacterium]